ncbi:MAG TPA: DNA primase [Candidatus Diapherotrites archaeon]|uniref:DNA primase DnaG n=1 Tax=Candidatus Iainarchaeum sp. TaxID=3101447 RepID=A0A7J4IU74_9ARCH|nr:DNA primase [Candidatus Diapherotrites archaeon]
MAKTYINTVKYQIRIKFEIEGIVDKPDIIGAIFGQSEGLLGDEMDLKELQKNGKIGRIEINHTTAMGRTKGEVIVPSSMDMAETSILAAGIESVDKVGPCEAKLEIVDIEDTRTDKRKEIKDRAKELLKRMMEKSSPETQTITEEIRENARAADITEYGPDKLPAGPEIDSSDEIIVVEGRADVINMLKNQIKNVIGMNGSNISRTITELSKRKSLTVFVDGDRGGELNARKLCQIADVEFIAKAPDGKEVEELTRKEILQSLKKKAPASEELGGQRQFPKMPQQRPFEAREFRPRHMGERGPRRPMRREGLHDERRRPMNAERGSWGERRTFERTPFGAQEERQPQMPSLSSEEEGKFKPLLEGMRGSMKAKLLDGKNETVKEVRVKDLVAEVSKSKGASAIVFDGVITRRLMEAAEKAGVQYVIGARKGKIERSDKIKAAAF